ncbi:MAG: hypothetical protein GY801_35445 [bacterium]|nr:hypothetical protein [bacterium]
MKNKEQFGFPDVAEYIKNIPSSDIEKIMLIGGQALNAWAEIYLREGHPLHPFLSKDLDFLASDMRMMRKLSSIWKGKYVTNKDDFSTHVGIITIIGIQRTIEADILSAVYGLDNQETKKKAIRIEGENFRYKILHPVHCLISRAENIVGLKRYDEHAVKQLRIAIHVVRARTISFLNVGLNREALNEIKMVFKYLKRNKQKKKELQDRFKIDIFDAIPNDERLGEEYVQKGYPQMKDFL